MISDLEKRSGLAGQCHYAEHDFIFCRAYLEHFVEHLPLETEKKAHKVLRLCEHRGMTDQGIYFLSMHMKFEKPVFSNAAPLINPH